ncbi:MAG: diaminobutyrate acetyltransferase [Halieaceae bacterium]|jgi:L-2,4-diaminobutyric acid acetyltransferase|nr:diaminobutyrate acetyltransferase [Halieaceae bacterium]
MSLLAPPEHILLRKPRSRDGSALHELVRSCPPLDENSVYCNLLQCTHFAEASVVGEIDGQLVCAISAYLVPGREDTLFIWQVAVTGSARGRGVAGRMLNHILARPACAGVRYLETTVTDSNQASWALFESFARRSEAALHRSPLFERRQHFAGEHETEVLARIGPLPEFHRRSATTSTTEYAMEKSA